MAGTFELVALALPGDCAPESLPFAVKRLIADCWPGMSRIVDPESETVV
jgi:hypothetical protein